MREYLSHTDTHHSVPCPSPHQTGVGIWCLETTLDGNRGDFPRISSGTPAWRGNRDPLGEAGRHGESVILLETCWGCDVENRQARKSRGLPPPSALSANVFQICSVLVCRRILVTAATLSATELGTCENMSVPTHSGCDALCDGGGDLQKHEGRQITFISANKTLFNHARGP